MQHMDTIENIQVTGKKNETSFFLPKLTLKYI